MQWVARILILVLGVTAAQDDQNLGDGSVVIKKVSPLEQLLATATASTSKEVSPLQDRQRVKRKPLRFRPKGESRFKPKNFKKLFADNLGKSKVVPETKSRFADFPIKQIPSEEPVKIAPKVIHSIDSTTTEQSEEAHDFLTTPEPTRKKHREFNHKSSREENIKSRFAGFQKRPRPAPLKQILTNKQNVFEEIIDPAPTETQPDILSTLGPIVEISEESPDEKELTPILTKQIPYAISNDISKDTIYTQSALFEDLLAKTGAQSVGVTTDIARRPKQKIPKEKEEDGRHDHARQLGEPRGRRRSSARRESHKKAPEEIEEPYEKQGQERKKIPLPPRRKKASFVKKKHGKNSKVGTVKNYRYKNEDGSITWGYHNDDGSFKEETIGVDCITHGRYGYTDTYGEQREYSYSSGVRCDPDTRKVKVSDPGTHGTNGHGYYDYTQNKFVMPDGRRVRVVVNQ